MGEEYRESERNISNTMEEERKGEERRRDKARR